MADLTQTQNDSYQRLLSYFSQYDLTTLAPALMNLVRTGASEDTITIQLEQTPEYENRFGANKKRVAKGLSKLPPQEYLATERAYRQIMAAAGLPPGFYDTNSDFTSFLENDLSPTELQDRVNTASEAYYQSPETMKMWRDQGGTDGEFIAMALDQTRAAPLVRQRIKSLEAQAIGQSNGVGITQDAADKIGATGASLNDIRQGVNFVATEAANAAKLGQLNGTDITTGDLVAETFLNDATAAKKRKDAVSAETSRFSGGSAVGQTTLSTSSSRSV